MGMEMQDKTEGVTPDKKSLAQARRLHWDEVYHLKGEQELSWHQDDPITSLALIREVKRPQARIIDIGGGSSVLAGRLLDDGAELVTVLDISEIALEKAKERIGEGKDRIRWIVGDIATLQDIGQFDIWHDRAVFHFLTRPEDRKNYRALVKQTLPVGGHLIVGTFSIDGPEKCSGLPVQRYDAKALAAEFGDNFTLLREFSEVHTTPWGKLQNFSYAVFKRVG
jgi:SAM-dependent methyltransferase